MQSYGGPEERKRAGRQRQGMSPREADDDERLVQAVQASVELPRTSLRVKTADEE